MIVKEIVKDSVFAGNAESKVVIGPVNARNVVRKRVMDSVRVPSADCVNANITKQ